MNDTLLYALLLLLVLALVVLICKWASRRKVRNIEDDWLISQQKVEAELQKKAKLVVKLDVENTSQSTSKPAEAPESPGSRITRAEIRERLHLLAESTAPNVNVITAMCYDMALPPTTAEYICPTCGAKTVYALEGRVTVFGECQVQEVVDLVNRSIRFCRKQIPLIEDLSLKLDESQFCKRCSPEVEWPKLGLIIEHSDGKTHQVWNINANDIDLITSFLDGEKTVMVGRDEKPLKDYINRLEELLGVNVSETEEGN